MFKEAILIMLLCSANLYAMEQPESFAIPPKNNSSVRDGCVALAFILACESVPKIEKYMNSLDEEELEKFLVTLNRVLIVASVAVGIYAIVALYPIFEDIYGFLYPSEAQKAATQAAIQMNKIFVAKDDFITCLMNNARTPRNSLGLPTACEELANAFGTLAGQLALDDITKNFKNAYPG